MQFFWQRCGPCAGVFQSWLRRSSRFRKCIRDASHDISKTQTQIFSALYNVWEIESKRVAPLDFLVRSCRRPVQLLQPNGGKPHNSSPQFNKYDMNLNQTEVDSTQQFACTRFKPPDRRVNIIYVEPRDSKGSRGFSHLKPGNRDERSTP